MRAIEPAVRFYEEPPTKPMTVTTDESELRLTADDWADASADAWREDLAFMRVTGG